MMSHLAQVLNCSLPVVDIVDIGAAPEGPERYCSWSNRGWRGSPASDLRHEAFEELKQRSGPGDLPYCVGDGTLRTFHVTGWRGCSSLYEPDPAVIDLFIAMDASVELGHYPWFRAGADSDGPTR